MNALFWLIGFVLLVGMGYLVGRWWWRAQKRIVSGRDVSESAFLFTLANFSYGEKGGLNPDSSAFRALQTGVECAFVGMRSARLLITSTRPGEGKSYVATMLGIGLAQAGQRVLLIEANLSRPGLAYRFNLPSSSGLTDLLLVAEKEQPDLMAFTQPSGIPNLTLLPAGTGPFTDLTLIRQVVSTAATYFSYVIVDGSAILSGGPLFPLHAQYAILVAATGQVKQSEFKRAIERLHKNGANILGVVLNEPQPPTNQPTPTTKAVWFRPVLNQLNQFAQTFFTFNTLTLAPALVGGHIPQPQTNRSFSAPPEPSPQPVPDLSDDVQLANAWYNLTLAHLAQQTNQYQEQLAEGLFILGQQTTALHQQQALSEAWRQKARLGDEAINRLLSYKNQLTIQVEQTTTENERLIEANDALNNQNQQLALTLERLTSEKTTLSRTLEQLRPLSTQLQEQLNQALAVQANLQQQLEQSQSQLVGESQEKRALAQTLEQTHSELERARQQWEQTLAVQANLNQLLAQFREELRLKNQHLALAVLEQERLNQALLTAEATLSGRDTELATAHQKLHHISQLYQRYRE